jgi:hypothetical protein
MVETTKMQRRFWLTDISPAAALLTGGVRVEEYPVPEGARNIFLIMPVVPGGTTGMISAIELKTIVETQFVNNRGEVLMFNNMMIIGETIVTLEYKVPEPMDTEPGAVPIAWIAANTETLNRLAA